MQAATPTEFGSVLRHWREASRLSQLDLALQADVSTKHLSFLETGRNQPSRAMILRLANALDLPLRDRNLMLSAAGFAGAYTENSLDSAAFSQVDEALHRILQKHEPYPAIVMDADWNILRLNNGAGALSALFVADSEWVSGNALELLFSEQGLQPFVVDWEALSATLLMRLFRETVAAGTTAYKRELFARLQSLPTTPENWRDLANQLPAGPTIDLVLKKGATECRFFTTVTSFGTPQDITLQELRIESYFPADETTRNLCESWTG